MDLYMILLIFNVFPIRIMFCEREEVRIQIVLELAFETVKTMSKCINRSLIQHWKENTFVSILHCNLYLTHRSYSRLFVTGSDAL